MDTEILFERIEVLAKNKGISKTKALIESGAGKDFISNIKKGQTPSIIKLQNIADYFEVSVDYLLGNTQSTTIQAYDENDNQVIIDDETREIIDQFRDRPELKDLMKVGDKLTKAQLISVLRMIQTMTEDK